MRTRTVFGVLIVAVLVLHEVQGQFLPIEPCLTWMKALPTCPVSERYTCCKTCLEPTCRNRNIVAKCAGPCTGGCVCRPGFVRVIVNGKCVRMKNCDRFDYIVPVLANVV